MIQSNRPYATPILSIRLFGSFCLYYREQALDTINTARLQSLLAYLVLQRDAPISRQHLAFLFWPDSSEEQARTNLRNLLHKLRAALPNADQFLSIDQHTIQWRASAPFTLDVDEFLSLAGQSASIRDLKAAVQIYAGDFMRDCYDEWAQSTRDSLRQTYLTTLEKLLGLLAENRHLQDALHYGQILLQHEPTREESYRHLMHLYAQSGDRASVSRIYRTCATVLERELGVEPSPATVKAYETFSAQATNWTFSPEAIEVVPKEQVLHNLPASLTSFIGRGQELEQVNTLLSKQRLVTLSGPGGIGKTRLALAAARPMLSNYRDGIFLVDLAPIDHSGMVPSAIADSLQAADKIRAAGLEGLISLLRDQNLLLLLDNCEHLTEEVGGISLALLQACPDLRILTTSREALNVYGETIWQIPALPAPAWSEHIEENSAANIQELQANASVELFIERAKSTLPTFKPDANALLAIGEICRHLEGMPLAIEMAAALVKTLTVYQIVKRLDNVLELLKPAAKGPLPRYRTMEAVMDWSFAMLTTTERRLFARLSVFSGHFSLEAAEKICQGKGIREEQVLELLASLVDKSLVETLPTVPEARFRLHEIARQYARHKLEEPEHRRYWQYRHLEYFVQLAEQAEPKLRGAEQVEWLNRLDLEQENLRAALRMTQEGDNTIGSRYADQAVRLVNALWWFWFIRGYFSEGRRWAEQVLAFLERHNPTSVAMGKVLYVAATFCYFQGDILQATDLSWKSLSHCQTHEDAFGEVFSYHRLGVLIIPRDPAQANKYLNQGLRIATQIEDTWLMTHLRMDLGRMAIDAGDQEGAIQQYGQALETARQCGDKFAIMYCLANLAIPLLQQGKLRQAAILAEESLTLSQMLGAKRGIAFPLSLLGRIALLEKQYPRAGELLKGCLQLMWSIRDRESTIESLVHLIGYEAEQGNLEIATRILAACEAALLDFPEGYRLSNQSQYDRLVETLQSRLEPGVFTAAWTLGRLMGLEQAVSFALVDRSTRPSQSL